MNFDISLNSLMTPSGMAVLVFIERIETSHDIPL